MVRVDVNIDELVPAPHLDVLSWGRSPDRLVPSVKRDGIAVPPVVSREADCSLVLVTGRARVDALRFLGRETVPAVVRTGLDGLRAFELAVEENLRTRGLNQVERAAGARYLLCELVPPRAEIERLLALTGVPRSPGSLAHHLALSRAPARVRSMVAEGGLSFHAFVLTAGMAEADRDALLGVIDRLGLGRNFQRELITLASDTAAGRGVGAADVLADPGLAAVLDDGSLSGPDRVKHFFVRLRRLRIRAADQPKKTLAMA